MNTKQIIYLHKQAGGHFFDKNTMKFFNSRVVTRETLHHKTKKHLCFFITSEQFAQEPRRYTVRKFDCFRPKNIETMGDFQEFSTPQAAARKLKDLLTNN